MRAELVLVLVGALAWPWLGSGRTPGRSRPVTASAAPFISYTAPAVAAALGCQDSTAALPLTPWDSLRVEAVFRRQAPTWPTLAARLAAGDSSAWGELWPIVKAEADSAWVRLKPFTPGAHDTMRCPIAGPGVNVIVTPLRRGEPGNRGCSVRRAVTP